jgi:hypothetical protein
MWINGQHLGVEELVITFAPPVMPGFLIDLHN